MLVLLLGNLNHLGNLLSSDLFNHQEYLIAPRFLEFWWTSRVGLRVPSSSRIASGYTGGLENHAVSLLYHCRSCYTGPWWWKSDRCIVKSPLSLLVDLHKYRLYQVDIEKCFDRSLIFILFIFIKLFLRWSCTREKQSVLTMVFIVVETYASGLFTYLILVFDIIYLKYYFQSLLM